MGLQLKTVTGDTIKLFKTLGNTSQMKNLMKSLLAIESPTDNDVNSEGWKNVKEAFENFGFSVVYDRNLAILTAALFVAISKSRCEKLKSNIQNIKLPNLGNALLQGDGNTVYEILNCSNFKKVLGDIGIEGKYVTKYINRMKKITPWKLSDSKTALQAIEQAFQAMGGENCGLKFVSTTLVDAPGDFKNLEKSKDKITSITISDKIKKIPDSAFQNFKKLKEVTIPSSITKIGDGAFMDCERLKEIVIPNSVTEIDDSAFALCSNLKKIKLSNKLKYIPRKAFCACRELEEITIPESVTAIYFKAFIYCKKLKKIIIPDTVTSIGLSAFHDCPENMEVIANDYIKEEVEKAKSLVVE